MPLGHTVATYARDVHRLVEGLGLEGVVLVGWSMGCLVIFEESSHMPFLEEPERFNHEMEAFLRPL